MTDAEIYHEWTLLNLSADRLGDDVEHCYRMGVGTGSIRVLKELREARAKAIDLADKFYDQHSDRINNHIKVCLGKEICK